MTTTTTMTRTRRGAMAAPNAGTTECCTPPAMPDSVDVPDDDTLAALQMSQAAWDALTYSAGGSKVDVQIAKIYNGEKYGPIYRQWILAAGKLHGTIYYNTYNSPLANQTGAMLRIKALLPGDQASGDDSSGLFVLAAGALLALVLASGSMVSVASRAMKGQLR